ncbi:MAG: hypothetical protein L0H59_19515, partial [Tomitella sp.]|nr:hypothetical protein [Tomitella sp.]
MCRSWPNCGNEPPASVAAGVRWGFGLRDVTCGAETLLDEAEQVDPDLARRLAAPVHDLSDR